MLNELYYFSSKIRDLTYVEVISWKTGSVVCKGILISHRIETETDMPMPAIIVGQKNGGVQKYYLCQKPEIMDSSAEYYHAKFCLSN